MTSLPIDHVMPELLQALRTHLRGVLIAPPGAGKTTRVPLALLPQIEGKILLLEPRRLAARSAADRMAQTLGEPLGQTVGYRMRGESKVSRDTRIEVVTEGILTRLIQRDPELSGVGAVIFDEFHERSLNADLGLALSWEIKNALREDLVLLVMSATLDAGPIASLLDDAPVVRSEGRAFDVETRYLDRPPSADARFEQQAAALITRALTEETGSALVFLPGEGEIRRVAALVTPHLPKDCKLHTLYGAMKFEDQRKAIEPSETGRKLVLATAIAETSLTIKDVRIVIDAGKARRARFDPASGMSRLVTEAVSKAEAEQRRGRAGRVQEGVCYRMWTKGGEGALPAFAPAEIEIADLTGLALELALWGSDAQTLAFLSPPPIAYMNEATGVLSTMGLLDAQGRITDHGRAVAALPVHPRLGHMLISAGPRAAELAAILSDRDPLMSEGADLSTRLKALRDGHPKANRGALDRLRREAKRLRDNVPKEAATDTQLSLGEMAALAYPDRIALRRKGGEPRYVLSNGKGAVLGREDPLGAAPMLVVTQTDGAPKDARIRQAVTLSETELRSLFGDQIHTLERCVWSKRDGKVLAERAEHFGALTLNSHPWKEAPPEAIEQAAFDGLRQIGLPWSTAAKRLSARAQLMPEGFPSFKEEVLLESLEHWLSGYLKGAKTEAALRQFDIYPALHARLTWEEQQALDRDIPAHFQSPLGRKIAIDYDGEHPSITARLQELFGTTTHPTVGGRPLRVILTSPAQKPVQTTMDLPRFWVSSYADVRKDMRGRYPKHPWPEDPTVADPTLRAKRRST